MASYLRAAARRNKVDESLEDWVTNRFGRRLFELFFKSYNEKVWGVPTSEIRAEWAAQRIRGLSFFSAAKAAFFGNEGNKVKSLISEFNYPRFGPGQMWDAMTDAIEAEGGEVLLALAGVAHRARRRARRRGRGGRRALRAARLASSRRCRCARRVLMASPRAPELVREAARRASLPRLHQRRARGRRRGSVPRQLDLHPRAVGPGRSHPELPLVVAVDGPGSRQGVRRSRVLLLRRRRSVDDERRRSRRARRDASSRSSGSRRASKVERGYAVRVPKAYPIYDADYAEARRRDPHVARRHREPAAGRAQRPAPLQQLGPLDAHRDARGRQPARRRSSRHLGSQRGERLPRDPRGRRASVPRALRRRPRCRRSKPRTLSSSQRLLPGATVAGRRAARRRLAPDRLVVAAERRRGADAPDLGLLVRQRLPHRLDPARRRPAALLARALPAGLVAGARIAALPVDRVRVPRAAGGRADRARADRRRGAAGVVLLTAVAPIPVLYATFGRPHTLLFAWLQWGTVLALQGGPRAAAGAGGSPPELCSGSRCSSIRPRRCTRSPPLRPLPSTCRGRRARSSARHGPARSRSCVAFVPYYLRTLHVLERSLRGGQRQAGQSHLHGSAGVGGRACTSSRPAGTTSTTSPCSRCSASATLVVARRSRVLAFCALTIAAPVLFFSVVPANGDSALFFDRYMIPATPAFLTLVVAGCLGAARWAGAWRLLALVILVAGLVAIELRFDAQPPRRAARHPARRRHAGRAPRAARAPSCSARRGRAAFRSPPSTTATRRICSTGTSRCACRRSSTSTTTRASVRSASCAAARRSAGSGSSTRQHRPSRLRRAAAFAKLRGATAQEVAGGYFVVRSRQRAAAPGPGRARAVTAARAGGPPCP